MGIANRGNDTGDDRLKLRPRDTGHGLSGLAKGLAIAAVVKMHRPAAVSNSPFTNQCTAGQAQGLGLKVQLVFLLRRQEDLVLLPFARHGEG